MPLAAIIKRFIVMLRRRCGLILAVLVLVGGTGAGFIMWQPPDYVASTKLLAKFGREYVYKQETPGAAIAPVNYSQDEIVNTIVEILRSREIARSVLTFFGTENLFPEISGQSFEKAVDRFAKALEVAPIRRSNIILLQFRYPEAELGANVLNKLVEEFQVKFLALYGEKRSDFVEEQLKRLNTSLQLAHSRVHGLEQQYRSYSVDTQIESLLKQRLDLDAQLQKVNTCCASSDSAREMQLQLKRADARIAELNTVKRNLIAAARERDIVQEMYDGYRRKLEEVRLSEIMDQQRMTSVEVIDKSRPPAQEAFPSRTVKVSIVLLLAGLLGLAIAWIVNLLSSEDTRETERNVEPTVIKDWIYDETNPEASYRRPETSLSLMRSSSHGASAVREHG